MDNIMQEFKKPNVTNVFIAVLGIIFLFFVAKTISGFKEIRYVGNDVPAMNVITVSGKGEIVAKPDTATFSFTVTEDAVTMKEAQDIVSEKVALVVGGAKDMGISEDDIKTTSYTSYPKYKYDSYYCYGCERGINEIIGYTVSEQVEIKVKNQENVSKIATLLTENKITSISGPNYSVYDEDSVREEARSLAIMDAKDQAEKLASDLGVKLGRVVSFYDEDMYSYMYGSDMSMGVMESKSEASPTISPGTNTITENVSITYEIK